MQRAFEEFLEQLSESVDGVDFRETMAGVAAGFDLPTFAYLSLQSRPVGEPRLTYLQRMAVARLAQELGWTLQSFGINTDVTEVDDFSSRMQGLRIAIYSLTESSSRQAKSAIEEIAPTAIVDCNADHGGTARLKALAKSADLFVVAWLSANHSATDFIRDHREHRPLLYAQGRGFSSILRAIEDYLS